MPRTKGSKNKPKTTTADFASQIAEKQSAKEALTAEIASITANIDTLKAELKEKKTALKKAEKDKSADNTLCIIEHFGNAGAVPQPPERCLSRQAGIVRYCLR